LVFHSDHTAFSDLRRGADTSIIAALIILIVHATDSIPCEKNTVCIATDSIATARSLISPGKLFIPAAITHIPPEMTFLAPAITFIAHEIIIIPPGIIFIAGGINPVGITIKILSMRPSSNPAKSAK
jgi:hypothetical protein